MGDLVAAYISGAGTTALAVALGALAVWRRIHRPRTAVRRGPHPIDGITLPPVDLTQYRVHPNEGNAK